MKIKTKILGLIFGFLLLIPLMPAASVYATKTQEQTATDPSASTVCQNTDPQNLQNCLHQNPIIHDINLIVNVLSGIVGIVVIGSVIFAGIQYSFAGASPQAAANARNRIISSMIAFGAFLLIFAFVQWLIPGGVFG